MFQPLETYRPAYDLKSKKLSFEKAEDHLNDLIELLTGNPTQEMLEEAIHIRQLLRAQAVSVFLGSWDDYWRNGNNYYLVRHPDTKQWLFVRTTTISSSSTTSTVSTALPVRRSCAGETTA